MVKANSPRLHSVHSARQPPDLSCMNVTIEARQQVQAHMTSGNGLFTPNVDFPDFAVPLVPPKSDHVAELASLLQLSSHSGPSVLIPNLQVDKTQYGSSCGLGKKAVPSAAPLSFPRRLFIFDRCQNQSRLVYSSVYPPVENPFAVTTKLEGGPDFRKEEEACKVCQFDPSKLNLQQEYNLSRIDAEESEMHEETEEINALLYSDDDDDGYSSDDEVRSTGRSPVLFKWGPEKEEYLEEITEEVAIFDPPNKRQKMLNGGYKSGQLETASSVHIDKSHEFDSNAESSYILGTTGREKISSVLGNDQPKKDKIRATLKILESMIPGGKAKDPLMVFDEAINYLKSMKIKAKALGVHYY